MTDGDAEPGDKADGSESSEEQQAFRILYTLGQDHAKTRPTQKPKRKSWWRPRGKKIEVVGTERELSAAALKLRDREQTMKLRLRLAWFTMGAVAIQLIAANLLFWNYLARHDWRVDTPPEVVVAWLSATVVEVIGIVLVIARNLFPSTEKNLSRRDLARLVKKLEKDD